MMRPCRITGLIVMALSITGTGFSQSTPSAAVAAYCRLDGEGAAYSSRQPKTKAFNLLQVNPVEAAWDESTVVKDCKILGVQQKRNSAEVSVIYHVLGTISSDLTVEPNKSDEKATFHVVLKSGHWKIDHSELEPHITKSGILAILKSERADAARQAAKNVDARKVLAKLDAAIREIETW